MGTCSWTDPTLVRQTHWYPRRTMSAAERLGFYAERFPIVEADSTYYFPPTPELCRTWAERSPDDFRMNVKAWSLLTGHPTLPQSLWEDMLGAIGPAHRGKRRLYASHLEPGALEEAWARFRHALSPLGESGRLGLVLAQYPRWFGPSEKSRDTLRALAEQLGPLAGCVEFRHHRWMEGDRCEETLELLEELDLAYVCVDEPQGFPSSVPPVVAATAEVAVVRFHGRNAETWDRRVPTAAHRFRYRYRRAELEEWVPRIAELAASSAEVHVLMNNCWRDDAVVNATQMMQLLGGEDPLPDDAGPPPAPWAQQRLAL